VSSTSDFAKVRFSSMCLTFGRNQFAECIRRSSRKKQLAIANLTWYRARVGGFVDALRVCCAGSRAQVEHNFIDVLQLFPVSASAFSSE